MSASEHFHTVVVGGGQAGLAAAYCLARRGTDSVVLESGDRIGHQWQNRWDSLRLFTPSKFDGLPGMPFPGADFYFPTKDETAEYLQFYSAKFSLPVRLNTKVDTLTKTNGSYLLTAGHRQFSAAHVIVATGAYQHPAIPSFASEIDPSIIGLHSSTYKNPTQLPEGTILVVGAGNSGAEIAIDLSKAGRKVMLAGRDVGNIPAEVVGKLFGGKPYWLFLSRVLSVDTPVGRKVRKKALYQGTPLIRLRPRDITDAGVTRVPRMSGASRGLPLLEDGRVLDVAGLVWATGFRSDFRWINLPIFDERGYPVHDRGIASGTDGIYFLGLHFQTALSSALLGGVGADAQFIVERIHSREKRRGVRH